MRGSVSCGYHCTAKPVSFGRGQSAVHTAAYNNRTQLYHEREGRQTKDYGDHSKVLFSGIFAPKGAPEWTQDRQELWNRAEAAERQKNGQPARNMIVALPHELNQQQQEWLLKDFAREQFARRGMIADVAMHGPDSGGDQRNVHAHILLTMRRLDGDAFAKTKGREWNSKEQLREWREQWAEKGARALARAGYPIEAERWRHGHKTLAEQRSAAVKRGDVAFAESLDREATLHKGPAATGKERRGEQSDRIEALQGVLDRNEIRSDRKAIETELQALEKELAAQQQRAAALKQLEQAARADDKKLRAPVARAYAEGAKEQAQEIRKERREDKARADQLAWRERVEANRPDKPQPVEAGLRVVNTATGVSMKLTDFVLDLFSGAAGPAAKPVDMGFTMDPALRKEQQLARATARQQEAAERKALESIQEDLKTGRTLNPDDIRHLTAQHLEQIRQFGDDGMKQIIEEAQKYSERYWKGNERERER